MGNRMINTFNVMFFPENCLVRVVTTAIQQLMKQILQNISKSHLYAAVVTVNCTVAYRYVVQTCESS